MSKKFFTTEETKKIGDEIGVNWNKVEPEEFKQGLHVELEHGLADAKTNVTNDDLLITGKIAWAHLNEFADYYTRLKKMENEAETYWSGKK
ncbi:hypothetical protein KKA93_03790 [Patescibacteria group bacterium]|nr:hypothetical protein [Patescibacteria group bacterium]MBU1662998.1 hypothetical protein [Patescibacteria group bacterium]MBU1934178.1 hypothetical protein [Patescibacteria group bacterium]MBU2007537.1 hypothetical protein [Patescibacteria group bacterium]MBU2233475.1 hypothetical protein [Patescibacteria group bacterium]